MRNMLIGITLVSLLVLPGCAHIKKAIGPLLPEIEADFAEQGFQLSLDPNLMVNLFCVEPDGRVQEYLGKVPFAGEFLVDLVVNDLIGECATPEETTDDGGVGVSVGTT